MKKKLLTVLATGMFIMGGAGMAQALTWDEVKELDSLLDSTNLANNSEATELAYANDWLLANNYISEPFTLTNYTKFDTGAGWVTVTDAAAGVFAHVLDPGVGFFMIKTGNVSSYGYTDFLFQNNANLDYAVVSLEDMGIALDNIRSFSHYATYGYGTPGNGNGTPVPEPASMLLLGVGLAGIYGIGRRRIKAA